MAEAHIITANDPKEIYGIHWHIQSGELFALCDGESLYVRSLTEHEWNVGIALVTEADLALVRTERVLMADRQPDIRRAMEGDLLDGSHYAWLVHYDYPSVQLWKLSDEQVRDLAVRAALDVYSQMPLSLTFEEFLEQSDFADALAWLMFVRDAELTALAEDGNALLAEYERTHTMKEKQENINAES